MVPDQSALQQIGFTLAQPHPINVFEFLSQQEIAIYIASEAKSELGFQACKSNLFSGTHINNSTSLGNDSTVKPDYVLSRTNASLTPSHLQPDGFPVTMVESNSLYSATFGGQMLLWDATTTMRKLLRNRRSPVDPTNINLARCLQQKGENAFVFLND